MKTTTQYETGATTHAVNDLILFTDNTAATAEIRDRIYSNAYNDDLTNETLALILEQLFHAAKSAYCKEMPTSCTHIRQIDLKGMYEYCKLFADDFNNWKDDHNFFQLTREGETIYKGLENWCYFTLQRVQGHSADWAMKYEGYKVTPIHLNEHNLI